MRKNLMSLDEVKKRILEIKGKDIDISINKGRKKIENYFGMIDNIYPSVFTVKVFDNKLVNSVSCSYTDVLCGYIKISEKQKNNNNLA